MRAAVLEGVGGPEQLVVRDVPEPEAPEGSVVVDVRAVGINFADVLIRLGRYPQMPELPAVLEKKKTEIRKDLTETYRRNIEEALREEHAEKLRQGHTA